jgi:hypothetical protein
VASLALCVGATGIAGLALSTWVVFQARRQRTYMPVLSDWVWHVAMPLVAYVSIAVAAGVLTRPAGGGARHHRHVGAPPPLHRDPQRVGRGGVDRGEEALARLASAAGGGRGP